MKLYCLEIFNSWLGRIILYMKIVLGKCDEESKQTSLLNAEIYLGHLLPWLFTFAVCEKLN